MCSSGTPDPYRFTVSCASFQPSLCFVSLPIVQHPSIALPRGHIMFTMSFTEIFVYAIADFASRWRPISSMTFDDLIDWRSEDITPAVIARLEDFPAIGPVGKLWDPELTLYRSPLRRDAYKLIVHHSGTVYDKDRGGWPYSPFSALLTYRFSISGDTCALERWERTSAIEAGRSSFRRGRHISYAGYGLEYAGYDTRVIDLCRPGPVPGDDASHAYSILKTDKRFRTTLSGYSHACLHLRDSRLVVSYYV